MNDEKKAPEGDAISRAPGDTVWHSSDGESGPDVGISVFLANGDCLFAGELPHDDGGIAWGIALYPTDGDRIDIARRADPEASREMIEAISLAITSLPPQPADLRGEVERLTDELAGCKIALEQAWAGNRERDAAISIAERRLETMADDMAAGRCDGGLLAARHLKRAIPGIFLDAPAALTAQPVAQEPVAGAPERTFVTWPNAGGTGLAFNCAAKTRTEYIRADLAHPATPARAAIMLCNKHRMTTQIDPKTGICPKCNEDPPAANVVPYTHPAALTAQPVVQEPVAIWQQETSDGWVNMPDGWGPQDCEDWKQYRFRPLYAHPATPAPVEAGLREAVEAALIEVIGGYAYDCTRVWDAWSVGTMGSDDFVPVIDRVGEIADAVIYAILGQSAPPSAAEGRDWYSDCRVLMANLDAMIQITGEAPEDEDGLMVDEIRAAIRAQSAPVGGEGGAA